MDRPRYRRGRICLLTATLGFCLLAGAGCGSKEGTVSGKVTLKGQPLPMGVIAFTVPGKSGDVVRSGGINNGEYRVEKIPPGEATVTVVTGVNPAKFANHPLMPGGMGGFKVPKGGAASVSTAPAFHADESKFNIVAVPPKYRNTKESPLKCTVSGGKQTQDFDLTP